MKHIKSVSLANEEKNRKNLLQSIKKKRLLLQKLVIRTEMVKVKLDILKREYMVKIGSLVAKDNHLDLDIIRCRNIIRLMEDGLSYEKAVEEIQSTYYAEQLEIDKENENIRHAEEVIEKSRNNKSEEIQVDARKLWKRLISKFHPDLTLDPTEKKRREDIMKQINMAYEEGDTKRLQRIETEHTPVEQTTVQHLEDVLVLLENEILEQEKQYTLLKKSEWYKWYMKISRTHQTIQDIFSDVEKKLLDDIVAKIEIVRKLKKKITTLRV
jgi:hypothetical protein